MADSLKKRYAFKLTSSFFNSALSMVISLIVPRTLGPVTYGKFIYVQNFFLRYIGFFEASTTPAFFSKISKRPDDFGIFSFFLRFFGLVFVLFTAIIVFLNVSQVTKGIFPDIEVHLIYLGLALGVLNTLNNIFITLLDAYGLTVKSELMKLFLKIVGVLALVVLFLFNFLRIEFFFIYYFFLFIAFIVSSFFVFRYNNKSIFQQKWSISRLETGVYIKDFYKFSHPLFVFQFMGISTILIQNWLLQLFGGNLEQGFYGFSYRISQICLLFTSAMTPLFIRDFSKAFAANDFDAIGRLFRKYTPLLFSISCFFCCFVALNASDITLIFGGSAYANATIVMVILAFSPIHQALGDLIGSLYFSMEKTKLLRNIGFFHNGVSLVATFLLLAPPQYFGLNMKSIGLSLVILIMQFLTANISLALIIHKLHQSFLKYLVFQIGSLAVFIGLAFISQKALSLLSLEWVVIRTILNGIVYGLLSVIVALLFPMLFGLRRADIWELLRRARQALGIHKAAG